MSRSSKTYDLKNNIYNDVEKVTDFSKQSYLD